MKKERFDVVVIGSGMGGLSSAGLLAAAGYKTLLLEKYQYIGGRFSTRDIEGYKLPTGAAGIEMDLIAGTWAESKADFPVTQAKGLYYLIDGKTYELPGKSGVRELLNILSKVEGEKAKIVGRIAKEVAVDRVMGAFKRGITEEEKLKDEMSFKDWLMQYTDNEKVLAVFQSVIGGVLGANAWEVPAREFFHFISKTGGGGYKKYGYSTYGNIVVGQAMEKAIKAKGSDVWLSAPVKKIVVQKGEVKSVIAQKGAEDVEIEANVVISNIGTRQTVELAGRENFTKEYLDMLKNRARAVSGIALHTATSDRPLTEAPGVLMTVGTRRLALTLQVTNLCPNLAPKGKHLAYVWGVPLSSIEKMKNPQEEVDACIQDMRDIYPEFNRSGKIIQIDVRDVDHEWPIMRAIPGWDMPNETPIPNLFNAGDGCKPYGKVSLPSAAASARIAVDMVKKKFKPGKKV